MTVGTRFYGNRGNYFFILLFSFIYLLIFLTFCTRGEGVRAKFETTLLRDKIHLTVAPYVRQKEQLQMKM